MAKNQEDFVGFSLGGVHSSELGIVRFSQGLSALKLTPEKKDITSNVQGKDGSYYWGSSLGKREITIDFAFDQLTEEKLSRMKQLFNSKELQQLILDEEPYKVYMVKTAKQALLKHIPFEENSKRIYKGTGSITFVSYSPYAQSKYEYVEDYITEGVENLQQWVRESQIPYFNPSEDGTILGTGALSQEFDDVYGAIEFGDENAGVIENTLTSNRVGKNFNIKNIGDSEISFKFSIFFSGLEFEPGNEEITISLYDKNNEELFGLKLMVPDDYFGENCRIIIDSKNYVVYYIGPNGKEEIANYLIKDGWFFNLPLGESVFISNIMGILEYHYLFL